MASKPDRKRLSREEIVQAALEIAEEQGIRNVSMRKVARHLDAGTMSLYHYVRTKDDLLALMDDAIMGEIVIPEGEMPDDWRGRVTLIAKMSLAAWMKRPWLIDEQDEEFRITENALRHMDQTIGALDDLDVSASLKFEIMSQVDDYVFGFAVRERKVGHIKDTDPERFEEATDFVEARVRDGGYPSLERMFVSDRSFEEQWLEMFDEIYDESRFDRGLDRLLDGVEAELKRLGALPVGS
ncbi:MAG: TetR/AcrR family transcriptional regulator C-terminal domain-containing protein [Solirubrobacterales bacterium]|nr:TetR/AcrR family transcriptional regulator C-terminal domain-containing protein [Solirubrobacterales bacterium]MCB8916250.1 TetR/AcrR family transcriptional regulator [Thermoleophilales bacterium]